MFASKVENKQVQISVVEENEYNIHLKELFESYAINENKQKLVKSKNHVNQHIQQNLIREALMQGYVEMSHINLTICSECQYAEYEAQHTTERLVSGG